MNRLRFTVLCATLMAFAGAKAQDTFSGYQVSPEGAWCWFADPRATHYENSDDSVNASWLGYIDVHGNIKATQYDFVKGQRNEVLVRSYFQPDDHDNPTFLVLPDERVLIIYSRHTDEKAFYYRVSTRPGDITSLGEEKKIVTTANTTYPSPFILSDDPGHFYLCWRGIGWHPTIAKFTLPDANDDVKEVWGPYQMVQSTGARPYAKYYSNGKDKLYVTYTTGHPDNEQPNWVYFNVININASKDASGKVTTKPTLNDIKGNQLSVIEDGKFNINKQDSHKSSYPYTVVDAPSNLRDWVWQIALDKNDNPAIAMVKISGGKDQHEYYYAKWTGDSWRLTDLADGGGRFHSSNTEYCYSGGEAIDPSNPNVIYLSIPTEGAHGKVFEIWKYTLADNGTVTSKEQITRNSLKNNVRPYVLPGSENSPLRLGWMNGDYYYWMVKKGFEQGYPTDIRCDYEFVPVIGDYVASPLKNLDFGRKTMTASDSEALPVPASGDWTLNLTLSLADTPYSGTILSSNALTFGVDDKAYPYLTVSGKTYKSTNILYTSDAWAANSSGTSGDNWPTKLQDWNLTLTYDGENVTVFRNGLIDQVVPVKGLALSGAKAGGYAGTLSAALVYDKALSQEEVKTMLRNNVLSTLNLPAETATDLVLPASVSGESVAWTSSHPDIIRTDGTFAAPAVETEVTLTATVQGSSREYCIKALPRDIEVNLLAMYEFGEEDVYEKDGIKMVKDLSAAGNDLALHGSAKADGVLDLSANKPTSFSSNGYATVPSAIAKGLRSYTVMFRAVPSTLDAAPRFYDFGVNTGNSFFFRAKSLAAGIKYNGGTTTFAEAPMALEAGKAYNLAVTFEAYGHLTSIYVNGALVACSDVNVNEPYMLALVGDLDRSYIGRTQWWDGSYAKDNGDYCGTIDSFRIYNTALTADEIHEILGIAGEDPSANVDCTEWIENADFEGLYKAKEGTGVSNDRALYEPASWSLVYKNGDRNDLSSMDLTCLYAELFNGISYTPAGGAQAYLIRQKWGASTIGLSQNLDVLPAGIYRLGAHTWLSGGGGTASFSAETGKDVVSSAVVPGAGEWKKSSLTFASTGTEKTLVSLLAAHTEDGTEQISGFDNVMLHDVTANASDDDLADLLSSIVEKAREALGKTLPDESGRAALERAADNASALTAESGHDALYEAFTKLRDALAVALDTRRPAAVETISAGLADGPVFDISGRRVGTFAGDSMPALRPGIYVKGNRKIVVK